MTYSAGFMAESWFVGFAKRARILDSYSPDLKTVLRVLNTHMPKRVERARPFVDEADPLDWLDKACKIDCLLRLEDVQGKVLRVAIDLTLFEGRVENKLVYLGYEDFRRVRRDLGIDRHWLLLLANEEFPEEADLLESLYEQADRSEEVALIDWKI